MRLSTIATRACSERAGEAGKVAMHVCVIGAGVVGVTTAWYLARQGLNVTLVDRLKSAAQGASYANGGQLSYSYVAPLAGPGVLSNLPDWLLNADSPLRFHPVWIFTNGAGA